MTTHPLGDVLADTPHDTPLKSEAETQRRSFHQNSLECTIYSLQPEIVSRIFFVYAQENDELFNLRWTRLLLVCRYWLDIGKNLQSLWSFIDVNLDRDSYRPFSEDEHRNLDELDARDIRRIDTQRIRAGLSLLTVRMQIYEPPEAKLAYATMFWEPRSLSSLDVGGDESSLDNVVRSMAAHRHTCLKTLTLQCYHDFSSDRPELTGIHTSMNILLGDNVPNLQHLSLSGLMIDFTLLHGLRSLRVTCFKRVAEVLFGVQDIASALARCPRLEVLHIVLPPEFQPDVTVSPSPLTLVHLDTMAVRATTLLCTYLFHALENVPKSARLLASTTDTANVLSMSTLTSRMGKHASDERAPSIRSIAIMFHDTPLVAGSFDAPLHPPGPSKTWLSIIGQLRPSRGTNHALSRWFFNPEDDENTYMGFDVEILRYTEDAVLSHVLHSWPLSEATHLDVRLFHRLTTSQLDLLLANLPALTTVIVESESNPGQILLGMLRAHLHEHGRRTVAHIIFDALSTKRYLFEPLHNRSLAHLPPELLARLTLMRVLVYCAEAARAGVPLDMVEIVNEPRESSHRIIDPAGEIEWSELYRDLTVGFVYEGVLHSSRPDLDGTKCDSFAL